MPCVQVDVMDVDLNLVIEVDLHLLTVIVIQLGVVPPLYVCTVQYNAVQIYIAPKVACKSEVLLGSEPCYVL